MEERIGVGMLKTHRSHLWISEVIIKILKYKQTSKEIKRLYLDISKM